MRYRKLFRIAGLFLIVTFLLSQAPDAQYAFWDCYLKPRWKEVDFECCGIPDRAYMEVCVSAQWDDCCKEQCGGCSAILCHNGCWEELPEYAWWYCSEESECYF